MQPRYSRVKSSFDLSILYDKYNLWHIRCKEKSDVMAIVIAVRWRVVCLRLACCIFNANHTQISRIGSSRVNDSFGCQELIRVLIYPELEGWFGPFLISSHSSTSKVRLSLKILILIDVNLHYLIKYVNLFIIILKLIIFCIISIRKKFESLVKWCKFT